jgi:hypothetical protein
LSELVKLGEPPLLLYVHNFEEQSFDQNVARLTQSPEGQRDSQTGLLKLAFASFHSGGMRPKIQLGSWFRDGDKVGYNEGIQTHVSGVGCLAYLLQVQSQIASGGNISGSRAANMRLHPVISRLGGTAFRYFVAVDEVLYRDVSSSDHSLEKVTTSGITLTDFVGIGGAAELVISGTTKYVFAVKNTGSLVKLFYSTTDITAGTVAFTNEGPIAAGGMYCFGLTKLHDSSWVMYGRLSGPTDGLHTPDSGALDATYTRRAEIPLGGFPFGESPATANRLGYVIPFVTELATAVGRRRLAWADFAGDSSCTMTYPNTDMFHVEDACWYLGGTVVAGDGTPGSPGPRVVLLDSNNTVRDLKFPAINGTTEYKVVYVEPIGRYLKAVACKSDGSDAQSWIFEPVTGTWHVAGALFTKADTPGGIPLAFATKQLNLNQRRGYDFTPDGGDTTKTNVYRQFWPADMDANPLLSNTSEKFHFGTLKMRSLQLDTFGPFESNKALTRILYGNRLISGTGGSYGTVAVAVAVDGNIGTFTSIESHTFDSPFEIYNVPISGRAFKTIIIEWGLSNGSTTEGNAETTSPNLLPSILEGVSKWPKLSGFVLELDVPASLRANKYAHITELTAALKALENVVESGGVITGKPTQRFQLGKYDIPATIEGWRIRAAAPLVGSAISAFTSPPILNIREVPGTVL